jgi:hypothetical protein
MPAASAFPDFDPCRAKVLSLLPNRDKRNFGSPRIAQRSGAAVGLRAGGELAIEFGDDLPVGSEEILQDGGGERRVMRDRRAVDGEARPRQRLEGGAERGIADEVVPQARRPNRISGLL